MLLLLQDNSEYLIWLVLEGVCCVFLHRNKKAECLKLSLSCAISESAGKVTIPQS